MARLLLIDPDRRALVALQKALREAGFTSVTAVPSGSFALTMLERDRPDLIVSRARIPDIDGFELCGIIRTDPALRSVRLMILAESAEEVPDAPLGSRVDRVVVGDIEPEAVVAEIQKLLASPAGRASAAEVVSPHAGRGGLRGSLGVMDIAEVTQAIALGAKSGHLTLKLAAGSGSVVFDRGRVVHAQFGRITGEAAFAAMVSAAHRETDATFVFHPTERPGPEVERTIDRSLESLLLSTAQEIDEGRADTKDAVPRR